MLHLNLGYNVKHKVQAMENIKNINWEKSLRISSRQHASQQPSLIKKLVIILNEQCNNAVN